MAPGVAQQALEVGWGEDDGLRAAAVERLLRVEGGVRCPGSGAGGGTERGVGTTPSMGGAAALSCLPIAGAVIR